MIEHMFESCEVINAPLPADPVAMVAELRALEELKCAVEARQARLAVALSDLRESESLADGAAPPAAYAEVALARRVSPHRGKSLVSLARILDRELPHTSAAFEAGLISEWRATIIARETACLSVEDRARVDEAIAADGAELSGLGDREVGAQVRQHAARLDAASVADRRRRAEAERWVTVRPAPDSMVYLTALLPVAQGVGVFAALKAAAGRAVGIGEATSVGAAMADEFVRRVVGDARAQPVALRLTMSSDALFDGADDPAFLADHGPLPAECARALIADNLDTGAKVWLKRLFLKPGSGELIAMESRARCFPAALGEFLEIRDRWCRTPWCNAPIRHRDHIRPNARGGETSAAHGQGLCVTCNQSKEAPGWASRVVAGVRHSVQVTTPTGHRYRSRAPAA